MPFGVSCLGLPIEVGISRTTSPLRVTVMVWVSSSAVATNASPMRNELVVPPACTCTSVLSGQKSFGRQRTCLSPRQ